MEMRALPLCLSLALASVSCTGFILESLSKGVPSRTLPRVGMFYATWHAYAFHSQQTVKQNGGSLITIEDLIRSNHRLKINDILEKYHANSQLFYYHTEPLSGIYCIYRKRPGESGHVPDCPNITSTLTRHARQITEAGVDFILVDLTNIGKMNAQADTLEYRPLEVLCEEWKKLREQGIVTPDIAAWLPLSPGDNSWRTAFTNVYMNSSYDDLILRHNGRKVIHAVASHDLDSGYVSQLESHGITVVRNWANLPTTKYSQGGYWRMMSPCMGPHGQYSTSVVDADCSPVMSRNSPLGSMFPVARSFQTGYASVPWQAAGALSGLTFKKQMKAALAARPDYLFISGWNELIAQPQATPFEKRVNTYWSMGLQNTATHPSGYFGNHLNPLWVDVYGEEFHRDLEPTTYSGEKYYQLLKSCVRVFRTGTKVCSNQHEECCDIASSDIYTNIFSLYNHGVNDNLLTTSTLERGKLLRSGWQDQCSFFSPGDSIFCHAGTHSDQSNTQFIMFSKPGPNRTAVYRCYDNRYHFFSSSPNCEGSHSEGVLGFASTVITSEMPRSLTRCVFPDNHSIHSLDHDCPQGTRPKATYGFVR